MSITGFQKWLNELNQIAFSNFTDQVLWLFTAVIVMAVWVLCIVFNKVDELNASMAFIAMWLGYLTGSSMITGARAIHERNTNNKYIENKTELEHARTERAKVEHITKERPALDPQENL